MDNIKEKLKDIKNEEIIWIIYIGIIIFSFYSNYLEKDYYLTGNNDSKKKYQNSLIIIFLILIFVYTYFLNNSYNDLKSINKVSNKKRLLIVSSFIGSLLIFISGIIFLFIAVLDENLDVEIAFN